MSVNGTESTPNIYLPCRLSQLTQVLLIYLPVQSQCHIWLGWNNIAPLCSSVCITRVARCIVYRAPFLLPTIARGSRFHAAPKNVFFSNGPPPQKTLAAAPRRGHAHRDEAAGGWATGRRTRRTDGRTDGRDGVQAEDSLPPRSSPAAPLARRHHHHQTVWRPLLLSQRRAAAASSVRRLRPSRSPAACLLDLISPLEAASSAAAAGWLVGRLRGANISFP